MRDGHRSLRKHGLSEKLQISKIETGNAAGISIIKLSHHVQHMVDRKQLHRLLGGTSPEKVKPVLKSFWEIFLKLHPDCTVKKQFEDGTLQPETTIPVYFHMDEGRGRLAFSRIFYNFNIENVLVQGRLRAWLRVPRASVLGLSWPSLDLSRALVVWPLSVNCVYMAIWMHCHTAINVGRWDSTSYSPEFYFG